MIDLHAQLSARRESDAQLVRGFIASPNSLRQGARKVLANRLRARCAAVDAALIDGMRASLRSVAERVGVSERNLHQQFGSKDALFAYPPPEFALAVADLSLGINSWIDAPDRLRPLVEELDANLFARELFLGLALLHHRHPVLAAGDSYFAHELRQQIALRSGGINPKLALSAGLFADCIRFAVTEWTQDTNRSMLCILDQLPQLLDPNSR